MDTRTGQIHELQGRSLKQLAIDEGGKPSDFASLIYRPDGSCRRCNGTGAVRKGLFSRRFKPCRCTQERAS